MMRQLIHSRWGSHGKPDLDKMKAFIGQEDRSSLFNYIGWTLFFVWVGFVWLMALGLGVGLLGIGVLTLGMQGVRYLNHIKVEGPWLVAGFAFVVGGFWELWSVAIPLAPVALIGFGIGLLVCDFMRQE